MSMSSDGKSKKRRSPINTASRLLKEARSNHREGSAGISDEHMLAALSIISKSTPSVKNDLNGNDAMENSSNKVSPIELYKFLKEENDGVMFAFVERLIRTHNKQHEMGSIYGNFLSLALNVIQYLLMMPDSEQYRDELLIDSVRMLPSLIEACWIRTLNYLKDIASTSPGGMERDIQNSFSVILKTIVIMVSSSEKEINNYIGDGRLLNLKSETIVRLCKISCTSQYSQTLLHTTLRIISRILKHGPKLKIKDINEGLRHVEAAIMFGLKFSSDCEFTVERGEALSIVSFLLEIFDYTSFSGSFPWSASYLVWFKIACGELTILLGRVLTIIESDISGFDLKEEYCSWRQMIRWICYSEQIFLSILRLLSELSAEMEEKDLDFSLDWEKLLTIRRYVEGAMNSVQQFLSLSFASGNDSEEIKILRQDASISCIRCLGAWLCQSYEYDEFECDNLDDGGDVILKAISQSIVCCNKQKSFVSTSSFRTVTYEQEDLFFSFLPGVVAFISHHPCSHLCLNKPQRMRSHRKLISVIYSYLFDLVYVVNQNVRRKKWPFIDRYLEWITLLITECGVEECSSCDCKFCSRMYDRKYPAALSILNER